MKSGIVDGMLLVTFFICTMIQAASAAEPNKKLTLCWAAWNPADALVELSKDFTKETNIAMDFEFTPWPNFTDRMLNELNSGGKLCDLIIGDSQWLGGAVENGHYVKLNDFFEKKNIDITRFIPTAVENYSAWPKGGQSYWSLPAMGDAVGWTYRKDWFNRPELQAEFKKKHERDLSPPKTWEELKETAEFFQNRTIDGEKVYGAAIYSERASEGLTMGVTSAMYSWGVTFDNPREPGNIERILGAKDSEDALVFYKSLYDCCTPPVFSDAYMEETLNAYKDGKVAMMMNFFALFPDIYKDPNVGGEKTGFFVNPEHNVKASTLGGQGISVVSYSDKQEEALQYIKWFSQPEVQKKWWKTGGYSCHKDVLEADGFKTSTPFAAEFLGAMSNVKDFWQEPEYAELLQSMQIHTHRYVVGGHGAAAEALRMIAQDWKEILESPLNED